VIEGVEAFLGAAVRIIEWAGMLPFPFTARKPERKITKVNKATEAKKDQKADPELDKV